MEKTDSFRGLVRVNPAPEGSGFCAPRSASRLVKGSLTPRDRRWNGDSGCWWVAERAVTTLVSVLVGAGYKVRDAGSGDPVQLRTRTVRGAGWPVANRPRSEPEDFDWARPQGEQPKVGWPRRRCERSAGHPAHGWSFGGHLHWCHPDGPPFPPTA